MPIRMLFFPLETKLTKQLQIIFFAYDFFQLSSFQWLLLKPQNIPETKEENFIINKMYNLNVLIEVLHNSNKFDFL